MAKATTASSEATSDRVARSRMALCEAVLDLVREGVMQPRAEQIAERAGLSRRSVFHHFDDLAALYSAAGEIGMKRCAPLLEPVPLDRPAVERLGILVERRSAFLEATAPFARALTARALVGPAAEQARRRAGQMLGRMLKEVERVFANELDGLDADVRAELVEALSLACSPASWEYLRRTRRASIASARAVMIRNMGALLRDAGVRMD